MPVIIPIVEGHGEVEAAAGMVRRILYELVEGYEFDVGKPKRLNRNQVVSDIPRFLEYAASEPDCGSIIILMDADEDCPQTLACDIRAAVEATGSPYPVAVVCPKVEYEAWFIASVESIRGRSIGTRKVVIRKEANCPADIEGVRDAKDWLTRQMPERMAYKPTQDQAPLTHLVDLELARSRSRSFKRLCHAVEQVVEGMRSHTADVTPHCGP